MTDADPDPRLTPPLADVPGVHEGRALLEKAVRLLEQARERPAALSDAREAIRAALAVVPDARPDPACRQYRRRSQADICLVVTCGRCAPLRAAIQEW
ncbi:hypothetical protein [Streptomyces buecherae]|uniref:Uncharacterized protein n=1 Tax=Streptomyces buecherae TaxID=2763006 RepID=A0A7H8NND5_9ACTN|nr:hypothetical protein [Streptomyces buecherae]QKW55028.1 hypothetical protein HUT08_36470 [Streptomyces buecherae]